MKKLKPKKSILQKFNTESVKENNDILKKDKINANDFLSVVMKETSLLIQTKINEELSEIKKELHDKDILIKILRNKVIHLNDEVKSLGLALCQLNIAEPYLLNSFKNKIKDSISVVGNDGKVVGNVTYMIYNTKFPDEGGISI